MIARASQEFVDQARAEARAQPEEKPAPPAPARAQVVTVLPGKQNPAAQNVDAVPLRDMMNQQKMSLIGKAQMVETIKEISAAKEHGGPPAQIPRPPPPDARPQDYLTLLYHEGTLQPNATNVAVLQGKVLPSLQAHPRWRLQIQAFAAPQGKELISAPPYFRLSRALALRSWLMNHGIEPQRMDLRALGLQTDRNPLDRIDLVFFDPDVDNKRH